MAVANPHTEKVQNLPLLCVETICKFTPTFKLACLYSNAVPLPGAFWNLGLETVLKKRLPLSLGADLHYDYELQYAEEPIAVFDASGAEVAYVTHPEAFRFSPLLEFIESAFLTVRTAVERSIRGAVVQFYVRDGEAMLSNLQNLTALSLVLIEGQTRREQKDLLASNLKHLLPQLESFVIKRSSDICHKAWVDQALGDFLCSMPMLEMFRLRRLYLPWDVVRSALEQLNSGICSALPILSGLSSLHIWKSDYMSHAERADLMRHVSVYRRDLTVLFVLVYGEFKPYRDAFRALAGLTTLGMGLHFSSIRLHGLTFDGSEVINSVSDLRIVNAWDSCNPGASIYKITTFFPNVTAVAIHAGRDRLPDSLEQATALFGERQLFPAAAKLSCFHPGEMLLCPCQLLPRFLANPHLPMVVDLSQIIIADLALDSDLLRTIYCAMQASSIKRLLLKGPVHREALPRLQSHVELNGDNAKVSAWKDRDLGAQPGILNLSEISEQTDFRILGTKTSGSLKGEQFAIRVFHQLTKRVDIFFYDG